MSRGWELGWKVEKDLMILEPEKRIPTGNNDKYDIVRNNGGKKKK